MKKIPIDVLEQLADIGRRTAIAGARTIREADEDFKKVDRSKDDAFNVAYNIGYINGANQCCSRFLQEFAEDYGEHEEEADKKEIEMERFWLIKVFMHNGKEHSAFVDMQQWRNITDALTQENPPATWVHIGTSESKGGELSIRVSEIASVFWQECPTKKC